MKRRFPLVVIVIVVALSSAGCQSEKAAMELVCNAPNDCAECEQGDPAMRAVRLAQHIDRKLSNAKVRKLFRSLANVDPAHKVRMLKARAQALGLSSCPLADSQQSNERLDNKK